jgi:twitching motility protein PilT
MLSLKALFEQVITMGGSDLHLTAGAPPMIRVDGKLIPAIETRLSQTDNLQMIYSILNDEQKAKFEETMELDLSIELEDLGRFRCNIHKQKGGVEAAFRTIPKNIRTLDELGLPPVVASLARKTSGLILVTGPTGMGKTTTLAAMLDLICSERNCLIITIEDPIEYVLFHKKGIVKQREVGSDTRSFNSALRHVLRQDPDVICIGEMRDLETIGTAITAAETGHLVLATLHTPNTSQTIDRIIDVFPPNQQEQIRIQLAACLEGILAQQLIPRIGGGRALAMEVLIATTAVRNVIRTQKTEQIVSLLQSGMTYGMNTMDASLLDLMSRGVITAEEAVSRAVDPSLFVQVNMMEKSASEPTPPPRRFFQRK